MQFVLTLEQTAKALQRAIAAMGRLAVVARQPPSFKNEKWRRPMCARFSARLEREILEDRRLRLAGRRPPRPKRPG
jgi:hypothetical protein